MRNQSPRVLGEKVLAASGTRLDSHRSAPTPGCLFEVVAHGSRGNAAFAHRVTDLVKSENDIARDIQTGNARPLVSIDCGTAVRGRLRTERDRELRANNPNLCFNWFSPVDARRDSGEALSIRQMVAAMTATFELDQKRIFITGLLAGGAMASIMLAAYPDIFAGGAIIAGLPFGCADTVGDAFARMRGQGYPSDARLAALVRDASQHKGPWPQISVWQGSADSTVDPSNARRIVAQWRGVHGISDATSTSDVSDGCTRQNWFDASGRPVINSYTIAGMGHGTPLRTGAAQPAPICSTSVFPRPGATPVSGA